jgi:hypothetical protein
MAGGRGYNSHLKRSFTLHAAYLWSIHDLLAYDILSGWCVHSRLRCPICMGDSHLLSVAGASMSMLNLISVASICFVV